MMRSSEFGKISIHAPRTGSDIRRETVETVFAYFNPRSPHGERPLTRSAVASKSRFQSTLPARGATAFCDFSPAQSRFQSTLPARGATKPRPRDAARTAISIHAPRTGSDNQEGLRARKGQISIHAPRTGSDMTCPTLSNARRYFNPRSPHGERPGASRVK